MSRPIWYDSTETGAPTLNNAAGSLLEVLRACLINGFNLKTVTSIVVASGVATATAATHGYSDAYGKLLRIEGAPEAGLNGDVQPLTVDTNTFTYACAGVSDGTYTGTITARRAPLDWVEAHTGTNKAIFARSAIESLVQMLRVDDTGTASIARILGVVSATDVDTYTGEFPASAQVSGGAYWQKGANNGTTKTWFLIGDELGFYWGSQITTTSQFVTYWFGDPIPFYAGDSGFTVLSAQTTTSASVSPASGLMSGLVTAVSTPDSSAAMYAATGILPAESTPQFQATLHLGGGMLSGGPTYQNESLYPNVVVHPLVYVFSTGPSVRGLMPGLGHIIASTPFTNLEVIDLAGGPWLIVDIRVGGNNGQAAFRLTDWRS